MGLLRKALDKLKGGLDKTRQGLGQGLTRVLRVGRSIDDDLIDEVEEVLIGADMGVDFTLERIEELRAAWKRGEVTDAGDVLPFLQERLESVLEARSTDVAAADTPPTVILVAGVNGVGKTTSIAKLARHFRSEGRSVMLAAADTFRAAAVEQLTVWSERLDVAIVKGQTGSDPSGVAYDAAESARAKGVDVLLVDTAGRLHTQTNLMKELEKIRRSLTKVIPDAPHEVILVLDATTGQNAVQQARMFKDAIDVTGLFLAKLDGTAKGGVVLAIHDQVDVPVKFIGTGETPDDIAPFDPHAFVQALFEDFDPAAEDEAADTA